MGEVYRAEDTRLGREVAIKVLREELASQPERLKRFEREARAASALDHPNIVTIHDIAEADGQHFIVMQYVAGRTLGDLMTRGRLELNKTLHYAIQIADGLTRSHQHGITHRDLKPDNIIVTDDGQVKILDFGLAKLTEPAIGSELSTLDIEHPLTQEGRIVGTAPYMSPEQTQGHPVDALSDIFSLGSVLYEMVTGRRAFSGSSTVAVLSAVAHEEPESVSALVPTVPLALERVIHRALRKQPERRFQSVADMRIELLETQEQLATGDVLLAEQVVRDDRARHTARWWWAMAAVVLAPRSRAGRLHGLCPSPAIRVMRPISRCLPTASKWLSSGMGEMKESGTFM
jgi:serine/threonine protein kinase